MKPPQMEPPEILFKLHEKVKAPVKVASIEALRSDSRIIVRVRSTDGAEGISFDNGRLSYCWPILKDKVAPTFLGQDAREVETLVDRVYVAASNYKLAGLAFWTVVGSLEFALFDLLGKTAGKPVHELLGGAVRKEIPLYFSSMRRDTTPEQEVDWVGKRLADCGGKAVKLKIGGRMSRNADAAPGRSEALVALARKTFGEATAIYVDANGSYDAPKAIEVGRMLEAHKVSFLEEPCPWEDYEETKRVADALTMDVAGGEQDTSLPRFRQMIRDRVVDVIQPDLNYNGGFVRAARVARMAQAAKIPVTPHSPSTGPTIAWMLHFGAATPNIGPHLEFNAAPQPKPSWFSPSFEPREGKLPVPQGPGLGIELDPEVLRKAQPIG